MQDPKQVVPRNPLDIKIASAPAMEGVIFEVPVGSEDARIETARQKLTAGYPAVRDTITSAGVESETAENYRRTQLFKARPDDRATDDRRGDDFSERFKEPGRKDDEEKEQHERQSREDPGARRGSEI